MENGVVDHNVTVYWGMAGDSHSIISKPSFPAMLFLLIMEP